METQNLKKHLKRRQELATLISNLDNYNDIMRLSPDSEIYSLYEKILIEIDLIEIFLNEDKKP